ncbi:3007_t:CDS:2, partial [Entrophospora sp. SA101]
MSSSTQRPLHGKKKLPEEEDATKLKFGEDFENEEFLFVSEVASLIGRVPDNQKNTDVYQKTLEYVNTFTKFHNEESLRELR